MPATTATINGDWEPGRPQEAMTTPHMKNEVPPPLAAAIIRMSGPKKAFEFRRATR
jgi:hypothetical protein